MTLRFFSLTALSILFSFSLLSVPQPVGATDPQADDLLTQGLNEAAGDTYDTALNLPDLVGNLIKVILSATGILFIAIIVYAGVLYNISLGVEEKVKTAKKMIVYSVIGLVIVVAAYALADFVVDALVSASKANTTDNTVY